MQQLLLVLNYQPTAPFGAMYLGAYCFGEQLPHIGIPTLCLKGDYLAVATLWVSEILCIFIINGGSLTNGVRQVS